MFRFVKLFYNSGLDLGQIRQAVNNKKAEIRLKSVLVIS